GVPVRLDESPTTTTHAKLIIIDNETVIIGSHNWTESALTRNHETSIMIQDKETATKLTNYFMRIWNNGRILT
ncbi:MAG: phospholipase D-like domain-containing protein, partial [Nitrososphaerota archaeon]